MSRAQQEQLGLKAAAQVYQQMPVLPDSSPETKYIRSLGKRLAKTIPPDKSWPFQFHVVADKDINAFALPGGPMFVNIGTITAADNEAELAGVMAHEMSHVYMQHSAKQAQKTSLLSGLAAVAGAITGQAGGIWGALAQTGIQFGAGTLILKYSRGDEAQADAVGAIILWKAGYNPMALADFFKKLEAKGGSGPQFLSDHPNPGNRTEAIQREIAEWPPKKYLGDSAQFAKVRSEAATVHAYTAQEIAAGAKEGKWAAENRKNGAVPPAGSGSEAARAPASVPAAPASEMKPSGNFQSTDLGPVRIAYPENWKVIRGQQPGSATIAPQAGATSNAVAYGAVIQSAQTPDPNMNAQQLAAAIAQSLESSDANMKQSGQIQPITVSGAAAAQVELTTVSPMAAPDGKPQQERDWLIAVPRGQAQSVFFVFVAPQADFHELKPAFEKMLQSVQFTGGN